MGEDMPRSPGGKLLGVKPLEMEPDHSRVEFQAREEFYNPAGVVQGGFLAAMLDVTMSSATGALIREANIPLTLEMKVSFIQPAKAGKLIGEGHVVHRGRSVVFMEGSLSTEDGSLVATATATARLVPFKGKI